MKKRYWCFVYALLLMGCIIMAAVLLAMGELLWGMVMMLCAVACGFLLYGEGCARGCAEGEELLTEAMEILDDMEGVACRYEEMFRCLLEGAEAFPAGESSDGICRANDHWSEEEEQNESGEKEEAEV